MPHEKYLSCIEACHACETACEHCASACLEEEDVAMMARCIALDRDCADICSMAARFMARGSEDAPALCALCAEICRKCAEECGKHDAAHCQECAIECERCAEECERMSAGKKAARAGKGKIQKAGAHSTSTMTAMTPGRGRSMRAAGNSGRRGR